MNTDRLLTRVFDKQERVMIYPGDEFSIVDRKNFVYKFYGVTDEGLIVETNYYVPNVCGQSARYTAIIPFGDRFVPMQCSGDMDKSKEKKLIYESDIVTNTYTDKDSGKQYNLPAIVQFDKSNSGLILNPIVAEDYWIFKYCLFSSCEIIGNKWENPELLEQDEGA